MTLNEDETCRGNVGPDGEHRHCVEEFERSLGSSVVAFKGLF